MKLPMWFWIGFLPLCVIQWSVGLWVESVTNSAGQALIIILVFSFIIYPAFSIYSVSRFKKSNQLPQSTKNFGKVLLFIGFITNPAVLQAFKQIF